MRVVVVLPLVADTTNEPRASLPLRRTIASESSASNSRPGSVVPPPVRVKRESLAAARAAATFAPNSTPQPSLESACISSWSIAASRSCRRFHASGSSSW